MVGASDNDRLVWIDCEMTGLDLEVDELVEIAVVVTDFELDPSIRASRSSSSRTHSALAHMNEFVTQDARELRAPRRRSPTASASPMPSSRRSSTSSGSFRSQGKAPLAGNTIGTDRMFLAKYMPRIDRWLHYRNVDVSSIKELSRRWYPARLHPRPRQGRRPPRPRRHPRIDPRTRLLPAGGLRSGARARRATARARPRPPSCRRSPRGCERIFWLPAQAGDMVGIAQLVERGLVVADVAGSSPVTHPNFDRRTGERS